MFQQGDGALSSAGGILAFLEEKDHRLIEYALDRLNGMVHVHWPEIADKVDKLEQLYENESFKARELAALVVAKVYFQLGAIEESMNFALSAGNYFDITETTEFVETIALECIDAYTAYRQRVEFETDPEPVDKRMEALVERMLEKSLEDGLFPQAAGIAIETRRFDILEESIKRDVSKQDEMVLYVSNICLTVVEEASLKKKILLLLVKIAKQQEKPDFINVCSCLLHLNDAQMVAQILQTLLKSKVSTKVYFS